MPTQLDRGLRAKAARPATPNRSGGWLGWTGAAAGVCVFGVCLIVGFNVGFAVGQPEPVRKADKPAAEVAKLTTPAAPPTPTPAPVAKPPEPVAALAPERKQPELVKPESMKSEPAKTSETPKPAMTKPPETAKPPEPAPKTVKPPEPAKPTTPPKTTAKTPVPSFAKVKVVLEDKCAGCHGAGAKKAGLDVRSIASLKKGGDGGPAITAGDPAKSALWESIEGNSMPPPNKPQLTDAEKKMIRDWIAGGAK